MPLAVVDAQWHCEEEEVFGRLHAQVVAGFDLSLVERQCEVVAVRRRRLVSEQQQAAASRRSNAQRHVIRRLSGMSDNKNNNNNSDDVSSDSLAHFLVTRLWYLCAVLPSNLTGRVESSSDVTTEEINANIIT